MLLHDGQIQAREVLLWRIGERSAYPLTAPRRRRFNTSEPYGLLLALALALLALPLLALLVFLTPAVLSLPLLLVTTAVFEGTVLPLVFGLMLLLVSTTPLRVALLLPVLPVLPEFVLLSPPQALHMPAAASKQRVAIVRRIFAPSNPD